MRCETQYEGYPKYGNEILEDIYRSNRVVTTFYKSFSSNFSNIYIYIYIYIYNFPADKQKIYQIPAHKC